jgi:hypothetical protein
MEPTTTYRIGVPVALRWATGAQRGATVRYFDVKETPTVMGGLRAIAAAVDQCGDRVLADYSPTVEPNPAVMGWPIGL